VENLHDDADREFDHYNTGAERGGLLSACRVCRPPRIASTPTGQHQAQTARGLSPRAAAMLSAKSSWIRAGRGHGMLGLDRSASKRLEESDVPGDVHVEIEGDGLVQTVVCRG
jgi:hypothetical protein